MVLLCEYTPRAGWRGVTEDGRASVAQVGVCKVVEEGAGWGQTVVVVRVRVSIITAHIL